MASAFTGIDESKSTSPLRKGESNLVDRSKTTTKNLTPIGRVDTNGFAALLGTDADEEDLAGVGSGNAFDDKEDVAGVGSDAPPSSTTPSGAGEKTEPTSTRSGLRFGRTSCSTSKLLCVFLTAAIGLGCSAFALSSYGSGGVSDLIESVFVPDAASIPVLDLSDTTPDVTADPASTPALMPHLDDRRLNDKDDDAEDDAEDDDAEDDDKDDDDAEDDDAKFSNLRGSDDDDASVSPPLPPLPSVSPSPPPPLPQGFCACLEGRGCLQQGTTGQYTKCRTSNPPACDECNDPSITYGTGNVYSGPGYPYRNAGIDKDGWCSQLGFSFSVSASYGARTDLSGSIKKLYGCADNNADEAIANVWRFCDWEDSYWRAPGNTLDGDEAATDTDWFTQVKCSSAP